MLVDGELDGCSDGTLVGNIVGIGDIDGSTEGKRDGGKEHELPLKTTLRACPILLVKSSALCQEDSNSLPSTKSEKPPGNVIPSP